MKIFVLGYTRTGKTSIAEWIAEELLGTVISGSSWIKRELEGCDEIKDKRKAVDFMTEATERFLIEDHRYAARAIEREAALSEGIPVIEGLRNPTDFIHLFNPKTDYLVFCNRWDYSDKSEDGYAKLGPATNFEKFGIRAIKSYVDFCYILDKSVKSRCVFIQWYSEGSCQTLDRVFDDEIYPVICEIRNATAH